MSKDRPLTVHTCNVEVKSSPRPVAFHRPRGVHLWYDTLGQLQPLHHYHFGLLDADERARAGRFKQERDRERFITGHGRLRVLLGKYLGKPPEQLHLQRGEFGKPYLEGHPLHFNMSDTKDAVLIAVADQPIGADIETLHRHTDHEQVAGHYFSAAESESIRRAPEGKRRFLELWTRKEAVLKASGVGLMDDLKKLEVLRAENRLQISHPDFARLAAPAYYVRTFDVDADHPASLAIEQPDIGMKLFTGSLLSAEPPF